MSEELRRAAADGDTETVRRLVRDGAAQTAHDGGDKVQKIPAMLLDEADENDLEAYGFKLCRTALALAAKNGHSEVVSLLNVHDLKDSTGKTPLHLACEAGHLDVVQLLLERGAQPGERGPGKATLLHLAIEGEHIAILEWLLEQRLFKKVDLKNAQGDTALHLACAKANLDCIELLLSHGADPNLANREKKVPLQNLVGALRWSKDKPDGPSFATQWTDEGQRFLVPFPEEVVLQGVETLLKAGARATGLAQAAGHGAVSVIERLLQAGADSKERDAGGNSPLELAKLYKRDEVVRLLEGEPQPDPLPEEEPAELRWGPELEKPLFGEISATALARLEEICGSPAQPCEDLPGAFGAPLEVALAELDLVALHQELLEQGCYLFQDGRTERLLLLPTTDRALVIAAMSTNGANCGIGPGYVVEWLDTLHQAAPFILTTIGVDILAGEFLAELAEVDGWAERMYDFCPDIVDQGTGTVEALAEELGESRRLFFWWD